MLPVTSPAAAEVFTAVLTGGPVSRVDVARRTGLSPAVVTKVTRRFIEAGYLSELDAERNGAGRPATPLAINADREHFLGVKVTADDLIGVVCDLRAQVLATRHRKLSLRGVPHVVDALAELVAELRTDHLHRIGVALAGDVDRARGVARYSPFLGWHDVPVAGMLTEATGLDVVLENDVKALTVAEQWFGEGVGASSFAVVTVGTGIGCGLVVGGHLVSGSHGVAGELGHLSVGDGTPCHCGGSGCIEAIASTEAIAGQARLATGAMTAAEAVGQARAGDQRARAVFTRAGHAIGLGLAAVANLIGPQRLVVTGEGLAAYDLLEEVIRETFAAQAFGAAAQCELIVRPLPFEEWARGAAAVAIQQLFGTPAT